MQALWEFSPFFSFSLGEELLKRRSNYPETVWTPLEAKHLNSFKNSFKETCKYVFSFILYDIVRYRTGERGEITKIGNSLDLTLTCRIYREK